MSTKCTPPPLRYYYTKQGRCIYVIEGEDGQWWIMPYKYASPIPPEENYILVNESSYFNLYFIDDKTIYIYNYNSGKIYDTVDNIINFDSTFNVYDILRHPEKIYDIGTPVFDTIICPPGDTSIILNSLYIYEGIDELKTEGGLMFGMALIK